MENKKTLYFYQVVYGLFINKSDISLDYCEVEMTERPKTYISEKNVPMFGIGNRVRKADIGKIIGYNNNTVVLEEKNDELAKELLKKEYQRRLDREMDTVRQLEAIINAVDQWKLGDSPD